jgi:hypothetical protein
MNINYFATDRKDFTETHFFTAPTNDLSEAKALYAAAINEDLDNLSFTRFASETETETERFDIA